MACRCLFDSHFAYLERECGDGPTKPARVARRPSKQQKPSPSGWWASATSAAASLYDNCAGYNLRHCYFRGFVTHKNQSYLSTTVKEVSVLVCFLLANFVVFVMICARICVQSTCLVVEAGRWLLRSPKQMYAEIRPSSVSISNILH